MSKSNTNPVELEKKGLTESVKISGSGIIPISQSKEIEARRFRRRKCVFWSCSLTFIAAAVALGAFALISSLKSRERAKVTVVMPVLPSVDTLETSAKEELLVCTPLEFDPHYCLCPGDITPQPLLIAEDGASVRLVEKIFSDKEVQ